MPLLRLAVVGVGAYETSRARGYLSTIAKLNDRYTLCAICDAGEGALQAAGDRFGVGARYTDFVRMLEQEQPDAVFILVPTDGQTVLALTAVDHGCHIITEIPYALTLSMGDAIAQACETEGVKWEVAENVWRWPHEQLKQEIVRQGLLGKITHARLCYTHGSYHGLNGIRMVLGKEAVRTMGYAQRVDVPPYQSYGGEPETVRWWESGTIEFEDGVTCLYEMPPSPSARDSLWEVEGMAGYLSGSELVRYSEGKKVRYPFEDIYEEIDGERVLSAVRVGTDPPVVWENPYKRQKVSAADDVAKAAILSSLHRAVTGHGEPAYGGANARRDMELWIAIRESGEQGNGWIDLPLTDETGLENRIRAEYVRRYGGDPVADRGTLLNARFGRQSAMWTVAGWL